MADPQTALLDAVDTVELVWLCAAVPPDAELAAIHDAMKDLVPLITDLEAVLLPRRRWRRRRRTETEAGLAPHPQRYAALRCEYEALLRRLLARIVMLARTSAGVSAPAAADADAVARRRLAGAIAAARLWALPPVAECSAPPLAGLDFD